MSTSTRRTAFITLVAILSVLAALLPMGGAIALEADEAPAPTAPAPDQSCTLSASADNPEEEFASCISVDAELNRAPAIGETAILTVDVVGEHARPDTLVTIDLPDNLEFAELPAGMSRGKAKAPHGQGQLQRASQRRDLSAAKPARYQLKVRAVAKGPATIRARAAAQGPLGLDVGADDLFITVGQEGKPSKFGQPDSTSASAVAVPDGTPRGDSPSVPAADGPLQLGTDGPSSPTAPGGACVTGSFGYTDNTGVFRNVRNFGIEVWDDDSGADDLLTNALTGLDGSYNICVDSTDADEVGNVDLFVTFASENSRWKVTNFSNVQYRFSTGTATDLAGTHDFGSLQSGSAALHPAVQAYDNAHDAYSFTPRSGQGCWDRNDDACRQLKIMWSTTSTDGNHMHPELDTVHLTASGASTPSIVVHEIGHWLMDEIYDDDYPPYPNCSPHDIPTASSQGCAWSEGFAEWYPARIYDDPTYYYGGGSSRDLEGNSWDTAGWDDGDTVEGRVASALIDISDVNNEGPWDRYTEGDTNIWDTFIGHRSATFGEFWQHRSDDGFVVDDGQGLSALYQSTIDYGLRDPLDDYAETTRSIGRPHNFRYDAVNAYWSVVAIRPGDDADLRLFDDRGLSSQLESSAYGGTTMDFVAVNGNVRPSGDYYPQVFGGTAPYAIELGQGSSSLAVGGAADLSFGTEGDVVAVRDVNLTAGVPYQVSANPADGQDIELFLMPAGVGTASRSEYAAASAGGGVGGTESVTFTPSTSGWFGLVVVNRSGSGTVRTTVSDGWEVTATATGSGTGYIHSNPAGIDSCSTSCTHDFGFTGVVELSAAAASGSTFTGWSGDCSGTDSCVLALDSDKDVQANFTLEARTLTVDIQGTGSGTVVSEPTGIDCTALCEADFEHGTSVTLYAYPDYGSTFAGWDVTDCDAESTMCTLPMTADKSVRPTFDIDLQAVDDDWSTVETNPLSIPVLDNDLGGTAITDYTQGSRGSNVDCSDGYACLYTPAEDVRSGTETFTYTIEAGAASDVATVTVTVEPCADLSAAISGQEDLVTDQTWVACSAVIANGTSSTATPMMPAPDGEFGVLTNGDSALIDGTPSEDGHGQNTIRGAYDVSILELELDVPVTANCLSFDVVFASDEYPDFVGSQFNDAFIAELGESTWEVDAGDILAPDNFAMDSEGAIMSINSAVFNGGGTTVDTGTGWTGATGLLHATTPVEPGPQTLYLSIFDQGDHSYDSAALVDSLQSSAQPEGGCAAGVNVPPQHDETAASTAEDTPVDVTVATDVDGDALAVEILTEPEHGTATVKAVGAGQGVITYEPDHNWHGTDTLRFSAADGIAEIDGDVTISVAPIDDAPVTDADPVVDIAAAGTTSIGLSGKDPDGDELSFEIVDGPLQGTLGEVSPSTCLDGVCSATVGYTPSETGAGPDSFSFVAVDGTVEPSQGDLTQLESAPQTITVNFEEVDDVAPVISGLQALGGLNAVKLTWTNPPDDDFTHLVIVKTLGSAPATDPSQGTEIYNRVRPDEVIGTSATAPALVPGDAYTFTAFAADNADPPNVSRSSVGVRGTTITLTPTPTTVVGTQKATLKGVLRRDDGKSLGGGRQVQLLGRPQNSTTSKLDVLDSAPTDAKGVVLFKMELKKNWIFGVRFLGGPSTTGSSSEPKLVLFTPMLTGNLGKTSLILGKSTALSGAISPHYQGRKIYVQKLTADGWSTIGNKTLGAPTTTTPSVIKYSFTITPPSIGTHKYRVRFPALSKVHQEAITPRREILVTLA